MKFHVGISAGKCLLISSSVWDWEGFCSQVNTCQHRNWLHYSWRAALNTHQTPFYDSCLAGHSVGFTCPCQCFCNWLMGRCWKSPRHLDALTCLTCWESIPLILIRKFKSLSETCPGPFEVLNFERKQKREQKFGFVLWAVTQDKSAERTLTMNAGNKELGRV